MFLYALYFGAFGVLLPSIASAYRLGPAAESSLFPAGFTGFVIGVLVCGALSDRFGRKAVLLVSIAGYGAGLALFGAAQAFQAALAASALIGAGTGAMETVAAALAADVFPEHRAVILNGIQVAFGLGATIGPTAAHWYLAGGGSWRSLYWITAIATAALFLSFALQPYPRSAAERSSVDMASLRAIGRQPAFWALCLAQALYVGAETGFFSWMPTYFLRIGPAAARLSGVVVTVFWVGMTIGRSITGVLVLRANVLKLCALLAVGGALFSWLTILQRSPLSILGFVCLTGLCFSGIFGLIMSEAAERYSRAAGTVFGAVAASGGVGGACIPAAVGVIAGSGAGFRAGLAIVPCACAGIALVCLLVRRLPGLDPRQAA